MPAGPPAGPTDAVAWSDLEGQPLVAVSRTSGNRIMDAALVRAGVSLSWSYEVTHLSTSLGLVEAGLGISSCRSSQHPRSIIPSSSRDRSGTGSVTHDRRGA